MLLLLLFVFQTTSSGQPFWSGPKRCPHPLDFDPRDVGSRDLLANRKEKSSRHVAMVANFLDGNKSKRPLIKCGCAPFQTSPILFNFI